MTLIEKKSVSDHIRLAAFPAAKKKGELVAAGGIIGFADHDTAKDAPGSVDVGLMAAVFQAAKSDIAGASNGDFTVGKQVYITSAGALSFTATGNTPFGTIVEAGAASFDFVRL